MIIFVFISIPYFNSLKSKQCSILSSAVRKNSNFVCLCLLCPDRSILKAPQCKWNTSIDNSPSQNTPSHIRHDGREIWKFIPPPPILYIPEAIAHSRDFCKWALSSINNSFYFKSKFRIMYLKNLQKAFRSLINCYTKYYNNNLLKVFENHYYISILYLGIIQIIQTLNIHILYKSD